MLEAIDEQHPYLLDVEEREKQAMEAAIEEWVAREKAEFERMKAEGKFDL